jgi:1-acyl-sn-glycerol-3-phosphate acyltransferase
MREFLFSRFLGAPAAFEGTMRMLGTAAADLGVSLTPTGGEGGESEDPLEARDPDYIRRTLPAWRMASSAYFRAEVEGLAEVPRDEPVLLVGNHSGGFVIVDTFVFAQSFYDHFGPERRFHQLAHDAVFKVPGGRAIGRRWGMIPASRDNMRAALDRGAALLVYPGGELESFRPSWESGEVDFAGRTGYVELALEAGVPIVPVVAIGGQETALFLGRGRRLAKALGLDRMLRLKVLPAQLGPPWGATVLDAPGRIPLPAKIRIRVLPKIDLHERLGPDPDVDDASDLVVDAMQGALDDLEEERSLPVVG